jgi:hypothetical protein
LALVLTVSPACWALKSSPLERNSFRIGDHEVDNITHAVSMIASTGAVALLPLYPNDRAMEKDPADASAEYGAEFRSDLVKLHRP